MTEGKAKQGTEKQIEWAEKTRAEADAVMWQRVEHANRRVINGDMPAQWAAAVYDAYQAIRAALAKDAAENGDTAAHWIENRARIIGVAQNLEKLARKNYKAA